MFDAEFQILFLGENFFWSTLSQALESSPSSGLQARRLDSLAALFLSLAETRWHAVVLDVHAWSFQGLHYVEKLHSEYPGLPIIALYSPSVPDLASKALTCGASRCLPIDSLSADSLRSVVAASLADQKSQSLLRRSSQLHLTFSNSDDPSFAGSRNQAITHALNNLLCVINANADILADHLNATGPGSHSLTEIKKAAQSAAALMRHLK
jgi:DNA-binding NtrC family response regulator